LRIDPRTFAMISTMGNLPDNASSNAAASGPDSPSSSAPDDAAGVRAAPCRPVEIGGRKGPEPTRYGDWEKNGRCIDF